MAQNLLIEYPGRVTAADVDYSYGSSKNETIAGVTGDGTPNEKERADDIIGFQQALLRSASIVPSESPDTQLVSEYMQAVIELAQGRAKYYDDTGIADAYVLSPKANQQGPRSYFDGQEFNFTPANINTGPSNIRFGALPVLNLFNNGAVLNGGELTPSNIRCVYNLADDRFDIQNIAASLTTNSTLLNLIANGSVPDNTIYPIPWDLENHDDLNLHDNSVNNTRITISSGVTKVRFTGRITISASAIGVRQLQIYKNGNPGFSGWGTAEQYTPSGSNNTILEVTTAPIIVTDGDYFELIAIQNSGIALTLFGNPTGGFFAMEVLSRV